MVQGCCPLKIFRSTWLWANQVSPPICLLCANSCAAPDSEALLFTPDDPVSLAQQIIAVLDHPELARKLGQQAAARAWREFTWSLAQARLLAVYEALGVRSLS
ncbi:MAG: glycosyltransferase [Chloroflexota bacterium]